METTILKITRDENKIVTILFDEKEVSDFKDFVKKIFDDDDKYKMQQPMMPQTPVCPPPMQPQYPTPPTMPNMGYEYPKPADMIINSPKMMPPMEMTPPMMPPTPAEVTMPIPQMYEMFKADESVSVK